MEQARGCSVAMVNLVHQRVKTFSEDNKTTTDYYIHVLEYLGIIKEKYADLLELIGESFPGEYYKKFLPDLVIQQNQDMLLKHLMWMRLSVNRLLIWLLSTLQDLEGRLQKVLKSVALVFINWDNWLMLSMNGIVSI